MSGQVFRIGVTCTLLDPERRTEVESSDFTGDPDVVLAEIREVLQKAADQFVEDHPSMFSCPMDVS